MKKCMAFQQAQTCKMNRAHKRQAAGGIHTHMHTTSFVSRHQVCFEREYVALFAWPRRAQARNLPRRFFGRRRALHLLANSFLFGASRDPQEPEAEKVSTAPHMPTFARAFMGHNSCIVSRPRVFATVLRAHCAAHHRDTAAVCWKCAAQRSSPRGAFNA
jgi:hypothetical protein